MKVLFYSLLLGFLCSCETTPQKNSANVNQVNGLYVFVYCQPQVKYEVKGTITSDFGNQMKDATSKDQKFGKRLLGALATTVENVDFGSKLEMMVKKAKDEYPDANGIVFEGEMDKAKVIVL
ncbi:MAG: hypothetical protein RIC35_25140 [Marinoscillum sp.]